MAEETPVPASITSADVARLAGVSRATVSFVLNDTQGHRVSEATRARVLDAARQLGYVPHAAARSLRAGRSNLVLIPASISAIGRLVSDWVDELHSELDRHGYMAVLHAGRFTDFLDAARAWAELRPAAVVALDGDRLTSQAAELLRRAGVRGLLAFAAHPVAGVHTIGFDHARIGAAAAEHLIARGRTRIGVVMPLERGLATLARPRLAGAESVAARHMATVTPVELAYTRESAIALARRWASLDLDAVFAYNDEYAALLLHALQAEGIVVPDQVAIVGSDDLLLSALQQPALTTVRLELPSAAQIADVVHELIETGTAPPVPEIEAVLIHRQTS
ncbi:MULTISPECIES: LacI family DNA-binding transcriptional regulator [unclassified Streptomyces]|uniref:LacI family DNA-binding transcriptional regulator n=1 Tax=unclassified Streptomyces TaxID=2593676 RepID=UPI001BEBC98D|nr:MULTISPECIES: LacI family DNA-binding transcriptional regulator [unclassified Streptomyces]MBT2404245.1 LacI family DNA-binding transcriptional regulator [Streptomyces sp. ISL-21]MBT2458792.1 LacI family DNA-binding transcriptional regulator [Streptomyces sp. ISL-86]MBT2612922.1 LacI family DNA-binding transcriptional regulator [Streptomyces sp. ISL-87]